MQDAPEQSSGRSSALQRRDTVVLSYWCHTCNILVVPVEGRLTACPRCQGETPLLHGTSSSSSLNATGLRYRGRHRFASESDLSSLGAHNSDLRPIPPSLSNLLIEQSQSSLNSERFMPSARSMLTRQQNRDGEDIPNHTPFSGNSSGTNEWDVRLGYPSPTEGSSSQFSVRQWDERQPLFNTRDSEPSWHHIMQEIIRHFIRRADESTSVRGPNHASDPGDYLDDSHGFEHLLSELAENENENHGPPPAAKSAVAMLPFIAIEQQHIDDDSATCPVCKDCMALGEMAKELPCQHLYHEACILPWLNFRNSCPVCRFELPTEDADYEAHKREVLNNHQQRMVLQARGGTDTTGLEGASVQEETDRGMYTHDLNLEVAEIEDDFNAQRTQQRQNSGGWGSGWLWYAARPLLSIFGMVLALTLGCRLIRAQEPVGNRLASAQLSSFLTSDSDED